MVLITADKGLCGAFNTNLLKAAQAFLKQNPDKQIELLTVGRKGRDFFRRRAEIAGEYVGLTGKGRVELSEALEVARDVVKRFTEDKELDKVFLNLCRIQVLCSTSASSPNSCCQFLAGSETEKGTRLSREITFTNTAGRNISHLLPRLLRRKSFAPCSSL